VKRWFLIALAATVASAQDHPAAPPPTDEPTQPPSPVTFQVTHVEDTKPLIIRIFNLPEGTREIVLAPPPPLSYGTPDPLVEASQPRIIRVFNVLDEGTHEIVLPPSASK
jgi:hypothetical protein